MAALPYAELISALDELPAFAIVNAENAPLEFEDEETGRKVSLFFVDVATARAQCARFAAQFPSLGLRLMPVGLGMAVVSVTGILHVARGRPGLDDGADGAIGGAQRTAARLEVVGDER